MHRFIKKAAVLAVVLALGGCGAQDPQPGAPAPGATSARQGEVCPTVSPGPPPVCPDGCVWNGSECRANRPIVIFDLPILPPTATAPIIPAPVKPPSSGP